MYLMIRKNRKGLRNHSSWVSEIPCLIKIINFWKLLTNYCHYQLDLKSFERQPHKMVEHTQTIRRLLPTNCLSVFDHIVELEIKGLNCLNLVLMFPGNTLGQTFFINSSPYFLEVFSQLFFHCLKATKTQNIV